MARLFTLKPELRTDKANARGLCPVVLHIHKVRRRFLCSDTYCRHTAATLLDDTGFSEAEIADVLGVTMAVVRGYITPNRSKANRAFEKKGGI